MPATTDSCERSCSRSRPRRTATRNLSRFVSRVASMPSAQSSISRRISRAERRASSMSSCDWRSARMAISGCEPSPPAPLPPSDLQKPVLLALGLGQPLLALLDDPARLLDLLGDRRAHLVEDV